MTTITLPRALIEQALETIEGLTRDRLFTAEWAGKHGATVATLRAALAQPDPQDPELSAALGWPGGISDPVLDRKTLLQQVAALRAALAQQAEPVARECSDPMCACRGGPCAECEEGEREKEIEDLRSSLYFYQRRCEALQSWQSKMRDPERTIVCDILANGKTLDPAFAGDRYTAPPQQAEPVEPGAWVASKDGRVIYDDASTDDVLLRVSGDFEDDEQRIRYTQQIVDALNAALLQRTMVPLTEEEIYHATGHCGVSKYTAINIARVIEEASWEKNNGQA